MKIAHIGKGTDILKELPTAPTYLGTKAKSHYKRFGKVLISTESLKRIHLGALEILAENFEQWEWAVREIRKKNKNGKSAAGYVQTFGSGAKNVSVEITIKRDAEKAIMQCFKQFGLDPKSEKELKATVDPAQGDLFEQFSNKKSV